MYTHRLLTKILHSKVLGMMITLVGLSQVHRINRKLARKIIVTPEDEFKRIVRVFSQDKLNKNTSTLKKIKSFLINFQ